MGGRRVLRGASRRRRRAQRRSIPPCPRGFAAGAAASRRTAAPGPRAASPAAEGAPRRGGFSAVRALVREHRLATVCEEAKCPNIGECWNAGTATLMLMGAVCTRACRFCSVDTGNPHGWLDPEEPQNAARTVELMKLRYVVLTSVDRDDLADGGAAHYAACVRAIKQRSPDTAVEALTRTFAACWRMSPRWWTQGSRCLRRTSRPCAASRTRRDPRRLRSDLAVLAGRQAPSRRTSHQEQPHAQLGESDAEIPETLADLRAAGRICGRLGQYLQPTAHHLAVQRLWHRRSSTTTAPRHSRSGSSSAWRARWCAPATAPSRR